VAIRRHGSRPPFFGVPFFGVPGNGGALCFHTLAQRLGSDQPFYGFQPQDQDGERTNLLEIENIATSYVREVRALQPDGLISLVIRRVASWRSRWPANFARRAGT
jgi:hypothetical protein